MNEEAPWENTLRRENGIVEHICKHGVGHPIYGSAHFMGLFHDDPTMVHLVHGCDGCCQNEMWQRIEMKGSVEVSNYIIIALRREIETLQAENNDLKEELGL